MNGTILLITTRKVILNICCYHGTDEASSQSILSNGKFIVNRRSNHWLGNGAYFFVNDFEKAKWWAKSITKKNDKLLPAVVLYFDLNFDDSELLNLNIEADLAKLDSFAEELFRDLEKNGMSINLKDKHERNCFVLDCFFKKYPSYKGVRRTFESTRKKSGKSGFGMLSDQLCIMDQTIIPFSEIKIEDVS